MPIPFPHGFPGSAGNPVADRVYPIYMHLAEVMSAAMDDPKIDRADVYTALISATAVFLTLTTAPDERETVLSVFEAKVRQIVDGIPHVVPAAGKRPS